MNKKSISSSVDLIKAVINHSQGGIEKLLELVNNEETDWLEFKASLRPKDEEFRKGENIYDYYWHVAKAVISMANTQGGAVIIGIDDNCNSIGLKASDPPGKNYLDAGTDNFGRKVIDMAIIPDGGWKTGRHGLIKTRNTNLSSLKSYSFEKYKDKTVAVIFVNPVMNYNDHILIQYGAQKKETLLIREMGEEGRVSELWKGDEIKAHIDQRRLQGVEDSQFNQYHKKFLENVVIDSLDEDEDNDEILEKDESIAKTISSVARRVPYFDGFLGREDSLEKLNLAINERKNRFLIINGIAGIGKSFLASKVAEDFLSKKDNHVVWVDCALGFTTNQLMDTVSSYCFSEYKLGDFQDLIDKKININIFMSLIQKNNVHLVLDDLHHVFPAFLTDQELLDDVQYFFKIFREVTKDLHIIITTRQSLPKELTLSMNSLNIQNIFLEGFSLDEYSKYLEKQGDGFTFSSDIKNQIHSHLEGHPKLLDLFCSLINQGYHAEDIIQETMAFDQPEIQDWMLDNIFSALNEDEKRLVMNLSQLKKDFGIKLASKYIRKQKSALKTKRVITSLISKFMIRQADQSLYRMHHIVKDYCRGQLHSEGEYKNTHRMLGFILFPPPHKELSITKLKTQKYEIFDALYHFYQSEDYDIASLIFIKNSGALQNFGMYKEIIYAYSNLEDKYKFPMETKHQILWVTYWARVTSFSDFKNRLNIFTNEMEKSNKRKTKHLLTNIDQLKMASAEESLDTKKLINSYKKALKNEKKWESVEYYNWNNSFLNLCEYGKALEVYTLFKKRYDSKRKFNPKWTIDIYQMSLHMNTCLQILTREEREYMIIQGYILATRLSDQQPRQLFFTQGLLTLEDDDIKENLDILEMKSLAFDTGNNDLLNVIENYELKKEIESIDDLDDEKLKSNKIEILKLKKTQLERTLKSVWDSPSHGLQVLQKIIQVDCRSYEINRNKKTSESVEKSYYELNKFIKNYNLPILIGAQEREYILMSVKKNNEKLNKLALEIAIDTIESLNKRGFLIEFANSLITFVIGTLNINKKFDEIENTMDFILKKNKDECGKIWNKLKILSGGSELPHFNFSKLEKTIDVSKYDIALNGDS